ncbi:hypothetical protein ACIQWI_07925 [Peribacillus frigoritolerans]
MKNRALRNTPIIRNEKRGKLATLLPNNWLAKTRACFDAVWQAVGGKGADF